MGRQEQEPNNSQKPTALEQVFVIRKTADLIQKVIEVDESDFRAVPAQEDKGNKEEDSG